jgi:cytoskeletal protein CcmA (bactofilin family)
MAKKETPEVSAVNLIAKGTIIKGDIQSNGDFRIDGILSGSLKSTGKVVVGASGKVDGEIICQNAEIEGDLRVKMAVAELLSLKSTCVLKGAIVTGRLSIEPGAIISGTCKMEDEVGKDNEVPKAKPSF